MLRRPFGGGLFAVCFAVGCCVALLYFYDAIYTTWAADRTQWRAWHMARWMARDDAAVTCRPRLCGSVLRDAGRGSWVPLAGLTGADIASRHSMDRAIRERGGWPADMFRKDNRCGPGHRVPGYWLQALCDPSGDAPCCNPSTGQCGITDHHCRCPNCTDLRAMSSAELARWLPDKSGCAIKNFTQEDACALINRNIKSMVFIGDSLLRHIFTATLLVLTGNAHSGGLHANMSHNDTAACQGEFQIADKRCSVELAAHSGRHVVGDSLCSGGARFTVDNIQDYTPHLNRDVDAAVRGMLGRERGYLVLGAGMHYQLDASVFIAKYLQPITELIRREGRGWPRVIWVEVHGINGFLRIDTSIHNAKIARFNRRVNAFLADRAIPVVPTFEMSRDLLSYDGRHYGVGFNLMKVQMMLNYLEEDLERCSP